MFRINGEFVIQGCDASDPNCLHTITDLKQLIEQIGFIPLFTNVVPGFSVEERTTAEAWDGTDSPWDWREILAADPDIAYGRFFDGKTGFIHRSWFPTFANYRRNGCDFEDLYYAGRTSFGCKKIMDLIQGRNVPNGDLKRLSGLGDSYIDAITQLQMQTYLIACDFEKRVNRRGQISGSLHETIFCTSESKWDYDFVTAEYGEEPSSSWEKIISQLRRFFPDVNDRNAFKLLGITVGDVAIGKPMKQVNKKEKIIPSYQLPWPESVITEIGLQRVFGNDQYKPLTDDQIEGLDYALDNLLTTKEKDIILRRYKEHKTYTQIGIEYERSKNRVIQICNMGIRKLRHPSRLKYYCEGLQHLRWKEHEEEETLKVRIKEIRNENISHGLDPLTGFHLEDLKLSTRASKCLIRLGVTRIDELEKLLCEEPERFKNTRNLGKILQTEILNKADIYGIDTKLARQVCQIESTDQEEQPSKTDEEFQ